MPFKFTPHGSLVKATIVPIIDSDDVADPGLTQFLLNPDTWQETKSTNWVKHNVPGLSDPHQQWISGGARTITFKALVTNDRDVGHVATSNKLARAASAGGGASVVSRIGGIAAQVFNIPELSIAGSLEAQNRNPANSGILEMSIEEKLAFYRSLTYPNVFDTGSGVVSPPSPIKLLVTGAFGKHPLGKRTFNSQFVVDKVDIEITKMLPDLTPIEAVVTFTLTELVTRVLASNTDILSDR